MFNLDSWELHLLDSFGGGRNLTEQKIFLVLSNNKICVDSSLKDVVLIPEGELYLLKCFRNFAIYRICGDILIRSEILILKGQNLIALITP